MARDVVLRRPDVIFETGTCLLIDLKASTTTIPIVGVMSDPVRMGLVSSVAKPGGNITGVSADTGVEFYGKRIEFLREIVPKISKVGFLASRAIWEKTPFGATIVEAAQRAGLVIVWPSDGPLQDAEYRRAFATMPQDVGAS
jgi:putative ABC transport system substrate-binding protein